MSLNTTPRTWVTNETVTATEFNTEIRDALTGIQSAWTAWTPTWTNLTIGNATVTARYQRFGKTILFRVEILGGSTTSASGAVSMSLPVSAHGTGGQAAGAGFYASGGGTSGSANLYVQPGAPTVGSWYYFAPATTAITVFGNAAVYRVNGSYEAA